MRLHNCTSASEIRDRFLPGRPQLNSFHDEWLREPSHSQANWWWSWTGSSGRLCTWHWHWIYTQTNIGREPTRPRWLDIFAYVSANGCDECVPPPPAIHSSASCSYVPFCTLANCSNPRASSQKCFISSQKNIPLSIACSLVRGSRQSGRIIYYFSTLHAKRDHSHGQAFLFKF